MATGIDDDAVNDVWYRVCIYDGVDIHVLLCNLLFCWSMLLQLKIFIGKAMYSVTPMSHHLGSGSRETSPALFLSRIKTSSRTNNKNSVFPDAWHIQLSRFGSFLRVPCVCMCTILHPQIHVYTFNNGKSKKSPSRIHKTCPPFELE